MVPHELDVSLKLYIEIASSFRKTDDLFVISGGIEKWLATSSKTLALWLVKIIYYYYLFIYLAKKVGTS